MSKIPKKAFFYYDKDSPPMSWLRRMGIESFIRHNPTWDVTVLDTCPVDISGNTQKTWAVRSDYARYAALYEHGGWFFDTDILFVKPIPDEYLDADVRLSLSDKRLCVSIGWMGFATHSPMLASILSAADAILATGRPLGYQSLGVMLWADETSQYPTGGIYEFASRCGLTFKPVSYSAFSVAGWERSDRLWDELISDGALNGSTLGVHWFGGDWTSREMEPTVDAAWLASRSMIGQALRKAIAT